MANTAVLEPRAEAAPKRPQLGPFAHVSFPCRDITEGKRFYGEVLGDRKSTRLNSSHT